MTHLAEPELYDLLEADSGSSIQPQSAAHVATCNKCRAELNTLRASVTLLRESTSDYAAAHTLAVLSLGFQQVRAQPKPSFPPALAWASAAVLVVAGAIGLTHLHHPAATATTPTAAVDTSTSDEALLQSVSDDINQPVPDSLRILAGSSTQTYRSTPVQAGHSERTN